MKKSDHLDASDLVYFPATILVWLLFSRWLPEAVASAVAVVLVSSVLYFLTRVKGTNSKGFFLAVLAAGIVTFVLSLIGWPGV